jgi:uncharacterized membrane protein
MARGAVEPGFFLVVSAAFALVTGCQEPVPGAPTYTVEIKPLFEAHCVRCHSADGVDGGTGMDPRALNGYNTDHPASHLNSFADVGDCDPDAASVPPVRCVRGAHFEALQGPMQIYVHATSSIRMPPAPAEALTSWELSLLDNWIAQGAKE